VKKSLKDKVNLHIFGRYFFPHIIKGDDEVPECHLDLIDAITDGNDGAVIFPRSFAKTSWEKIDTIHDIVYSLEPVILYISSSLGEAQFHFESIKSEFERNENLIATYGYLVPPPELIGQKWTNTHFETTTGVNMVARGAGKGRGVNIKNQRPTKIIADDIETDEQVRSSILRQKLHDWLFNVILPSKDSERGFFKMIGTVIHPECEILKFYKGHGGIFRQAKENGHSIWPAMWPDWKLERLENGFTDDQGQYHEGIGKRAFMQEYMNQPINDTTSVIKREWIEANFYQYLPDELEIKMAVDPNAGLSTFADYMAISVIGKERKTGDRFVLDRWRGRIPITQQAEKVLEYKKRWNPNQIGIEKVKTMNALYQYCLDLSAKDDWGCGIIPLNPKGEDKLSRLLRFQPLIEQGKIKFNRSHEDFHLELEAFPNGEFDDMCDSFIYCLSMFGSESESLDTTPSPGFTAGLINKKF